MWIGDLFAIDNERYRILQYDSGSFCLNNIKHGGTVCHVAWKMNYLLNSYAKEAIEYDVTHKTTGFYAL